MKAISYILEVDGSPLDTATLEAIQLVEVETHTRLADMLRLRLAIALDASASAWGFLDERIFERLTDIRVSVAVGSGDTTPLIDAKVIEVRPSFANAPGNSYLDVIAMDATVLMNLEEKVRPWPNMADSDIAEAIFGEYGLDTAVEPTQPTRQEDDTTIVQRCSDIQFLRQLADRNGFEVFVETNPDSGAAEGHFHAPRVDETPQGTLSISLAAETNVNTFNARYDMIRPATVSALGLDIDTRSNQSAEITAIGLEPLGDRVALGTDRPRHVLLSGTGLALAGELQTSAQAAVDRAAWAITAEGDLNTIAYGDVLRVRRPVMVRGAGTEFSGTYYVDRVHHVFTADGYEQRFALRRNARGVRTQDSFVEDDALPA